MSSIDNRVVEMEFDNKQFQAGVKDTLSSLEALKQGLKLEGATKGFSEIDAASKNVNLDGIAQGVDHIADRFSAMGAIGFAILQRLTNAAIDFGKTLTSKVMDPLIAGGKKRAMNLEQAHFMFEGLGMDAEAVMDNALEAVLGTAFGLDEAAKAASQFGASGMEAGDDMTSALRAISGVAAMTNSSYEDMSQVFTKVAGNGRLMGDDLLRLSARGLNAAATLGEAFDMTEAEVREMVTAGEVSFEMFYQAMDEAFGEQATKANETYTGSLANMRAALSRIGASFFTDWLVQQRDLFNSLAPAIDSIGEALEPVIEMMINVGRTSTDDLIRFIDAFDFSKLSLMIEPILEIVKNIGSVLMRIIHPIKDAFKQIFPPTTIEQISEILWKIEEFTESLKMGAGSIINLRRTFAGLFAILGIGWEILKAAGTALADLFGFVFDGSFSILEATGNIGDFLVALHEAAKNGEGLTTFFTNLGKVLKAPLHIIKELAGAIFGLFDIKPPDPDNLAKGFEFLGSVGDAVMRSWERILNLLRTVRDFFEPLTREIGAFFGELGAALVESFEDLNFDRVLDLVNTAFGGGILLMLRRLATNMGNTFGSVAFNLTEPFRKLTFTLDVMQTTLRSMTLMQIAAAVALLAGSVLMLSKVDAAGLARAMTAISGMMAQLLGSLKAFTLIGGLKGFMAVSAGLILYATALRILTSSVKALAELSWQDLAKGLTGATVLIGALTVAVKGMSGNTAGMISAGAGLLVLAFGIKVLASAVSDIAALSWSEITKGLVGVGALLTGLTLFTKFAAANKGGLTQGAGLVLLATGIKILASAVEDFSTLSWGEISKGLGSIGAILTAFTIFAKVMGNPAGMVKAGASLILISAAMNIMAAAMAKFGDLEWGEIIKGLVSMAGALVLVVGALLLMPPNALASAAALVAVSVALNLIASAMGTMGGMSWEELAKGLVALAGSLLIIAAAMYAMTAALPGAAATLVVAGALAILAPILVLLGSMSWGEIVKGLAALAGVFVVLGIAGLAMTPVVPTIFALSAAIAILGVGLLAAGAGVLMFSMGLTALAAAGAAGVAAIVSIVEGLIGLIPSIVKSLGVALVELIKVFIEAGPLILKAFSTIIMSIVGAVRENLPDILKMFRELAIGILEHLEKLVPRATRTMFKIMMGILTAMQDYVPDIVTEMINLVTAILNALADGIPGYVQAATDLMVAFLNALASSLSDVITAGADVVIALINGISDNMVRIVEAGVEAVINFVNGVADAIRDNTEAMNDAGANLATAIIEGMVSGLTGGIGAVASAAKEVASSAYNSALETLGIRSPSKEFKKIGKWVNQGFVEGLVGGRDDVLDTWNTTRDLLRMAMDGSRNDIQRLKAKLQELQQAKDKDLQAIRKTKNALAEARGEYTTSRDALREMNREMKEQRQDLLNLGKQHDKYTEKLDVANQKLDDAIQTRNDYRDSIKNQYSDLPDLTQETGLEDYINNLEYANADITKFTSVLQELRKMGLSDAMYEEFLTKGPDILPFVEELVAGGEESVDVVNDLSSDLARSAKRLGRWASVELYQAGVDSAQGLVDGLNSKRKAVEKEMSAIAKSIRKVLRLQLKIKSPSKIMEEMGGYIVEGLAEGMVKAKPKVDKSAMGVGDDAVTAMKKSIAEMNDILAIDPDMNPTITPVLDLSAFHRDATQIGSELSNQMIDLDSAYSKAKYASNGYISNEAAKLAAAKVSETEAPVAPVTFNQYNQSPKALSSAEIYRQTKNQLSIVKKGAPDVAQES